MVDNPFFAPSDLPYQLPPFERIDESHYRPAFERGMAEERAEIDAIVAQPEPPSFENTIVAMERTGRILERVSVVFFNQASSDTNDEVQAIQSEVAPQLAAHHDAILLNPDLFARVKAVHDARDELDLDPESRRLLERYYLDFVRAGAALTPQQQERLREINGEISALSTEFQKKLLDDTNAAAIVVDDAAELDGLTDDAIAGAAETARERGHDGKYVLTLILPTAQPALSSLTNRKLRERIHRASVERGSRDNEHNTAAIAARLVALRAERAVLLGYPNHAAYALEDSTAGSPGAVHEKLDKLAPAAVANAQAEAAELQEAIGDAFELRAWDWSYYAERVRQAKYDIDATQLRPYFELERVLQDGVFFAANQLYGLSFTERTDLVGYHPDARVFEVHDEDGSPVGLFIGDFYTRDAKRGGAWMNSFVDQSSLLGTKPVVINNMNITRSPAGEPTLMTFDEVTTMFHEFGHALHGLVSDVRYPKFSGTNVRRDFVEFPSQVNEMWATWPEVLANYARHYQTGEPLPQELVRRLLDSRIYGEGFRTTEYLGASLLDLAWHELDPERARELAGVGEARDAETAATSSSSGSSSSGSSSSVVGEQGEAGGSAGADERRIRDRVASFEGAALEAAGVALETVPPRYRTTYFAHIFAGGYSAGYYSYIWSEVLDADTVEWFKENGGLKRANGDHFRRTLLARGGSMEETDTFREFRGRDPQIEPLLQRRGLFFP